MFISSLAHIQSRDLFNSADGGLVFGKVLPILLVEMQNVEKRVEYCLKVLFVRLIGGEACLEFGARLWSQAFAMNFQNLGCLLRNDVLLVQLRSNSLRLRLKFAPGAKLFGLRL